jgi:hypothetical protein
MALCQAVWVRVRTDEQARAKYERIAQKNPKHKKKGIVALMRAWALRCGTRPWRPEKTGWARTIRCRF